MPEGPEVKRDADLIMEAVGHRPAQEVFFGLDKLKDYGPKLSGLEVQSVEPRGKALLIRFQDGWNIYTHNQLYGKWYVRPAGAEPDTNRQLRLAIRNDDGSALLYSASQIEVLRDDELDEHDYLSKLGPDPLAGKLNRKQVLERLRDDRFCNRSLATLLLDQGFLAGIGNYLRAEICFTAGLHPETRPSDCSAEQLKRLAEALLEVPRRAYLHEGRTIEPELSRKLEEEGRPAKDYRRYVYKREGRPCHRCGNEIVKKSLGGRSGYYCPRCQKSLR
ncbi:MAG TPA: endonuclease VIII [Acidobacteriota bacterium]|nr:endonuclease VIII [Acidobacteriota bacterium]